jgi:hypothetical protein
VLALGRIDTSTFGGEKMERFADYDYMKALVILSIAILAGMIPIINSSYNQNNALYVLNVCLQLIILLLILVSLFGDVKAVLTSGHKDPYDTRASTVSAVKSSDVLSINVSPAKPSINKYMASQ